MMKEAYESPSIVRLGSIADLTLGGGPANCFDDPDPVQCLVSAYCELNPSDPGCPD